MKTIKNTHTNTHALVLYYEFYYFIPFLLEGIFAAESDEKLVLRKLFKVLSRYNNRLSYTNNCLSVINKRKITFVQFRGVSFS